ncbi:MAG: DUF4263 domain-containing protein [Candidatus ainarchaeum sp.]|nr:DUF4263 domain-containing protein [Candidatus ainarchaeum sp.]
MGKLIVEEVDKDLYTTEIFVIDEDNKDKKLVYLIDKTKKKINFFPKFEGYNFFQKFVLDGFIKIPNEFNKKGGIKSGILYYFDKLFKDKNVRYFTISKFSESKIIRFPKCIDVNINYFDFKKLKSNLTVIDSEKKRERSLYVDLFFNNLFSEDFSKPIYSTRSRINRILESLNKEIITDLNKKDIIKLFEFLNLAISESSNLNIGDFKKTKIKVDILNIEKIILEFNKKLKSNTTESEWGEFLNQNLYLIDYKYLYSIPEINLMLGGIRKADFGLIDFNNFLDIFEIKKPTTPLLSKKKDRGNYYWSNFTIKAIVQLEKYLFNANTKRAVLKEDLKREKNVSVDIVSPKGYLIIGSSSLLTNDQMREDFKILRGSLKNIEIILYDELLKRLELQTQRTNE